MMKYHVILIRLLSNDQFDICIKREQCCVNMDFSGLPHIVEKIFKSLDLESALNCRLVCSNWKKILDNPMLWLMNCPKKHSLSRTIFKKSLIKISKALDESQIQSKYGLLLMECYLTKCKRLDRSLEQCQSDHSYLIWPLVIAIKKHKDMSMVKKIISCVGNPKCLKSEKELEKVCCFLRPKKAIRRAIQFEQFDIVELMHNLNDIIAVDWNDILELVIMYGRISLEELRIIELVLPSCEISMTFLCTVIALVGRKRENAIQTCDVFIKELAQQNLLSEAFEHPNFRLTIKHFIRGPRRKEFIDFFKDNKEMQDYIVRLDYIYRNVQEPDDLI